MKSYLIRFKMKDGKKIVKQFVMKDAEFLSMEVISDEEDSSIVVPSNNPKPAVGGFVYVPTNQEDQIGS